MEFVTSLVGFVSFSFVLLIPGCVSDDPKVSYKEFVRFLILLCYMHIYPINALIIYQSIKKNNEMDHGWHFQIVNVS